MLENNERETTNTSKIKIKNIAHPIYSPTISHIMKTSDSFNTPSPVIHLMMIITPPVSVPPSMLHHYNYYIGKDYILKIMLKSRIVEEGVVGRLLSEVSNQY